MKGEPSCERLWAVYLTEAVDEIREKLIQQRLTRRRNLWATIVKQIAKQDSFDGHYADTILEAIRALLKPFDDETIISLWRETEVGMCDDADDDCLFPFSCRMDLEMEILQQTTDLAWWEAEQSKKAALKKKKAKRKR
jgi:hypothetical protein